MRSFQCREELACAKDLGPFVCPPMHHAMLHYLQCKTSTMFAGEITKCQYGYGVVGGECRRCNDNLCATCDGAHLPEETGAIKFNALKAEQVFFTRWMSGAAYLWCRQVSWLKIWAGAPWQATSQ